MTRWPEAHDAPNKPNPEMMSPIRPPQLKACNCHCGCPCSGESEGESGGSDQDGASACSLETLVPSNHSEADEDFRAPPSSDGPEGHIQLEAFETESPVSHESVIHEFLARFGGVLYDAEGTDDRAVRNEQSWSRDYNDDMSNSMIVERGSDEQSIVSSDFRSIHCISPGPGLGAWADEMEMGVGMRLRENYFLEPPYA